MRIDSRIILCTALLAAAALNVNCSEDSSTPMSAPEAEMVLATFTTSGSSSGPDEPAQPYAMIIELGVDDHVLDSYAEVPEPMLFADRTFGDDTNIIFRHWSMRDFEYLADRMTDGENNTAYVAQHTVSGGGGSTWGYESSVFEYASGLERFGPDLIGYTITGLQVELDIEVTQNAGRWTQAHTMTISILGR